MNFALERRILFDAYPDEDFYFFDIAYKLDDKIGNYSNRCGIDYHFYSTKVGDIAPGKLFIVSDTYYFQNKKIPNGRFYTLTIYIPKDVSEGNFYDVSPIPEIINGPDTFYTSFALESNREEEFRLSNISYRSGGIKIKSSQPEQAVQTNQTSPENIINSDQPNADSVTQPLIITDTIVSTEETTLITSSTLTTSVTSSSIVTTTSAKITTTNTSENITEITTTFGNNKEDNKTNILRILFIIIFLIFIITITLIIRKRKNK